jgi:hypothetical protein
MSRDAARRVPFRCRAQRGIPFVARALGTAVLVLSTGCDTSGTPEREASPATPATAQTGELLIASAPEGWIQVGGLNQDNVRIAEYANPENLSPDLVDSVRFESQTGDPLPDPIDLLLGMREQLREQCEGMLDHPIFSGYENGYATSVRLLFCRAKGDPPRGEVRMIKAIRAADQFYIVSRSRSTPPFEPDQEPMSVEDMAQWSDWFGGISVCDTRKTEHPCPAPTKP